MNTYDIGDLRPIDAVFEVNEVPTDPSTVSFTARRPDGTLLTYQYGTGGVYRVGIGAYTVELDLDQRGVWWYRWAGTGAAQEAREGRFYVRKRQTVATP